jgi:hypothetical protein
MFARTDATSVFDSGSPGARRNSAFGSASGRRRADGETTRRERATGRLPASATIGARLVSTVSNAAAAFWLVVFVDDGPAFVTRVAAPHQGDGPSLDRVLETNRRSRAAEFAPFGKSKSEHSKNPLPSGDDASWCRSHNELPRPQVADGRRRLSGPHQIFANSLTRVSTTFRALGTFHAVRTSADLPSS